MLQHVDWIHVWFVRYIQNNTHSLSEWNVYLPMQISRYYQFDNNASSTETRHRLTERNVEIYFHSD